MICDIWVKSESTLGLVYQRDWYTCLLNQHFGVTQFIGWETCLNQSNYISLFNIDHLFLLLSKISLVYTVKATKFQTRDWIRLQWEWIDLFLLCLHSIIMTTWNNVQSFKNLHTQGVCINVPRYDKDWSIINYVSVHGNLLYHFPKVVWCLEISEQRLPGIKSIYISIHLYHPRVWMSYAMLRQPLFRC